MSETADPAVLRAWMYEREARNNADASICAKAEDRDRAAAALTKAGARGTKNVHDDVVALLEERASMGWRIAELQRLVDDGYDVGNDKRVLRASRRVLHFVLTGRLSE